MGRVDEALPGLSGGSVDQPAAALVLAQSGNRFLAAQEHALRVHRHDLVPVGLGHRFDARDGDDACILNRDVDPAEFSLGRVIERDNIGLVRDIGDPSNRVSSGCDNLARNRFGSWLIGGDDDRPSLAGETSRQCGADAPARSGDDDRLA